MSTTSTIAPDPRYPIGRFQPPSGMSDQHRHEFISEIAEAPEKLRKALVGLSDAQLDTPYREGGWTVRQVVHHMFDSHVNAYVRFKLALTEDEPTIKPYDEALWADLPDARTAPAELSVSLLDNLHKRWVLMMRAMSDTGWARRFQHPERGIMSLDFTLALYAWHGRHHVAHITELRRRNGW
ncbi:MAG TPA: bacillithiol transferase BstA [Terriglobales bacterium]|nr:bacillithiol transferase BstA [Terriglobales bacterium]